ncbi:MAG TPA: hypothetical protein VHO72_13735 [Bacteroidales bacterium]|nr:hypothetical protein [Bacteroidales bacterium]
MFNEEEEYRPAANLPIFEKGKEIFEVVRNICELFPEDNERLQHLKEELLTDAATLSVKVRGAETAELYDIKMEAAAIIRKAAKNLIIQNYALEIHGFEHVDYYNIVRDLIEEYRLLFIDWVASFDKWNYIIDRWGLFNPPGVGPFDKYPDEDIPFNDFEE